MKKILIVSNRLPVMVKKTRDRLQFSASTGGLAVGLQSLEEIPNYFWLGWPGISTDQLTPPDQEEIERRLHAEKCSPVFFTEEEVNEFYHNFCNKTLWPLFHYFPLYTVYNDKSWSFYQQINRKYCEEVLQHVQPEDMIWIHDYQLMLLPQMLREKLPHHPIGFFLHIPFPNYEIYRLLPWRKELMEGVLGADLIGFHTYDYVRHFLGSVSRLLGLDHYLGEFITKDRVVKVDAYPMGIQYEKYAQASQKKKVQQAIRQIQEKVKDCRIIMSVDRLDYTKGIIERLEAFDWFLTQNPQYRGKVILILVAVPSRAYIDQYQDLKKRVEGLIGKINGTHGNFVWMPVWYLYRSLSFHKLVALYDAADIAWITPLRDGMNLIAKEFIASKKTKGVLILSETAGAASELGEAIVVNANDRDKMAAAIRAALEMPESEQSRRIQSMQERLRRYNITRWAQHFIQDVWDRGRAIEKYTVRKVSAAIQDRILDQYQESRNRLFLLDYDGTLRHYEDNPDQAYPDAELLDLITHLARNPANTLVIISGRDHPTLEQWLGRLNVHLVAEHGAWMKEAGKNWQILEMVNNDWKAMIRPVFELYADRTPGSSLEEKNFSLVWHTRRADPELARIRTQELKAAVSKLTENLEIRIFEGNKILEAKPSSIHKGRTTRLWLARQKWDFIMAAGDDYTDEDMFEALAESAITIKVGHDLSHARYFVDSSRDIRRILHRLTETNHAKHRPVSAPHTGSRTGQYL